RDDPQPARDDLAGGAPFHRPPVRAVEHDAGPGGRRHPGAAPARAHPCLSRQRHAADTVPPPAAARRPRHRTPATAGSRPELPGPAPPPAAPPASRSVRALSPAIEIVGADPDARLFQEIRERLGLGYDVGASVEHGVDWAVAVISASAAREHEDRLLETVERTCRAAGAGF